MAHDLTRRIVPAQSRAPRHRAILEVGRCSLSRRTMHTPDLDALLTSAAEADWTHVVRRCAWCGRVADKRGRYRNATIVDVSTVYTDGMCPPCGARALPMVRQRQARALRRPEPALAA